MKISKTVKCPSTGAKFNVHFELRYNGKEVTRHVDVICTQGSEYEGRVLTPETVNAASVEALMFWTAGSVVSGAIVPEFEVQYWPVIEKISVYVTFKNK